MNKSKRDEAYSPEHVETFTDARSGLSGAIVLHSTALGPAAGGCRLWHYPTQYEATADALRLAQGMSYKNALAGIPLGGGKAVLRKPQEPFDRRSLFQAFGEIVDTLEGRYVTAEDVGTTVEDMKETATQTSYVAGLPPRHPGSPGGDPSPWTARGVFVSMKVAVERHIAKPLSDCTVAIQGLGNVGSALADLLYETGAKLIVCDPAPGLAERVRARTGATCVSHEEIASVSADVFAPCALGGAIDENTVRNLKAHIICGGANNQLSAPKIGMDLADRDILYAPDYVVNAGGIINVAAEYLGWPSREAQSKIESTGMRLTKVLDFAEAHGLSTNGAADRLACQVIEKQTSGTVWMAA